MRAQANLPAVAVALLLVTATTGVGLTLADGAFRGATRDPVERGVAVALAERLVAPESPLTTRANVLAASELGALDATTLETQFPLARGHAVRLRLDDRTVAATGDPHGGTTVRRIVLVEHRQERQFQPELRTEPSVTLPRRTSRVRIIVTPPPATVVETVRVNGRVHLHNATGLRGTFDLRTSRFETTTLRFDAGGPLPPGSVTVTSYPGRTTKAHLAVTVDA